MRKDIMNQIQDKPSNLNKFQTFESRTRNGPMRPSQYLEDKKLWFPPDQRKEKWSPIIRNCASSGSFDPFSVCIDKATNVVQSHSSFSYSRALLNSQSEASFLHELRQEKGCHDKEMNPDLQLRLCQNKGTDEHPRSTSEINTALSLSLKET
ncbi:hypothetical protein HanPI659440_Chr16g0646021 [Helianthus annuus]|nr:hypothetical protein HanPI659440_Chr16g0646021 [Helianthus annuus]